MNSNRAYMHSYYLLCKWFFNSFFLSLLSNYNKLVRQNKKEEENNHPTTKYRNLAQKNIPKSTEN